MKNTQLELLKPITATLPRQRLTYAVPLAFVTLIILAGSMLWAQARSQRPPLMNRNATVISEVNETPANLRGLQISRIGQAGTTALSMTEKLRGEGISVSNVQFSGVNLAAGTLSGGSSAGLGFDSGILISSGAVSNLIGPNNSASKSTNFNQPGDPGLTVMAGEDTFDAAVLEFDFVPQYNKISLEYLLASEEYPEMIDYADVLAIWLDGVNIALIPGTSTPVSIGNVNHLQNQSYYVSNIPANNVYSPPYTAPHDCQADGFTLPLHAIANVVPGATHHLRIAIADLGDNVYDSWLMMKENSFHSACDLAVWLDNPLDPAQGSLASYQLRVKNFGIVTGQDVVADFRLPFGSVLQGVPANVTPHESYHRWNIGSLEHDQELTLDLSAFIGCSPAGQGIAMVNGTVLDNDTSNNRNIGYQVPLPLPDTYQTNEDVPLELSSTQGVLCNDQTYNLSPPEALLVEQAQFGGVLLTSDGSFIYTPQQDYHGPDSFTYRIWDGSEFSSATVVQVTVTPVNDLPVLNFLPTYSTPEDTDLHVDISLYTSDVDSDPLIVTAVSQWDSGTWSFNNPILTLDPAHNWFGTQSIIITVSDGAQQANSGPITIFVDAIADLVCEPVELNFGNVPQGESSTIRLFINNLDTQDVQLQPPYLQSSNPVFSFGPPSSASIPSGGSVWADISFSPALSMTFSGDLSILHGIYGESPLLVSMSGNGLLLPQISVSPAQLEINHSSGTMFEHEFTISNLGEADLNWSASLLAGAPLWMSLNLSQGIVPEGQSSILSLHIDLDQVTVGTYTAILRINSDASNNPVFDIPVNVTVSGNPNIWIEVTELDFGLVHTGVFHTRALEVSNIGPANLQLTAACDRPEFGVSPNQISIPPFGSAILSVNLLSQVEGNLNGNLIIISNDPLSPSIQRQVSANLIAPPILSSDSYSILALGVAEEIVSKQLRISNTGSQPLSWQASLQDTGDGNDWVSLTPENGTLEPGQSRNLSLVFHPSFLSSGSRNAILLLQSNDIFNSNQAVNLTYIKQDYYFTFFDNTDNPNTNTPDQDMGVTVTNNSPLNPIEFNIYANMPNPSSARLVIRAYDVDDQSGEVCPVRLNGHPIGVLRGSNGAFRNSIFSVDPAYANGIGANLVSVEVDTQENGDGMMIVSGQLILNNLVLDAQLRYIETDKDDYIAGETISLTIEVDTQLSNQGVIVESQLLSPTGNVLLTQARAITVNGFDNDAVVESITLPAIIASDLYELKVSVYDQQNGMQQDMMSTSLMILPNQARLTLGATLLDFGVLPTGVSRTLPLSISNTGNEVLQISTLTASIPGISSDPASANIEPQDSQTFNITLQSNQEGSMQAVLMIQSNDPQHPVAEIEINAELIPNQAYIQTIPGALDFGQCFVNTPQQLQIHIQNLGPLSLLVSSAGVDNPAFSVSHSSFELDYNESIDLQVSFLPLQPGNYNSILQIQSNAFNSPLRQIAIYATAVLPPHIDATPLQVVASAESGSAVDVPVQIYNTGGSDLLWSFQQNLGQAISLDGYESQIAQYVVIPNRSSIQLAGGHFTVSLSFKVTSDTGAQANGNSIDGGIQYLLCKSTDSQAGFFGIYTDGTDTATTNKNLVLKIKNQQQEKTIRVNGILNLHQWYQVAAVYQNSLLSLYLDGNLIGSTSISNYAGNTDSWVLGKYSIEASRNYRFQGCLDELRIFSAARGPAYLRQTLYSRLNAQEPDLAGYWSFDAGNLHDVTTANNHGTGFGDIDFGPSDITPVPDWIDINPGFGTEIASSGQVLQLNLDAGQLMAGTYPATLTLISNAINNPHIQIPVDFTVTGSAILLLNPTFLDFGPTIINTSKSMNIAVSNPGTDQLELSGLSSSNAAFGCSIDQLTIPPQQSLILPITFSPLLAESYTGSLSMASNIPDQPQISVELTGMGALPPVLSYTPSQFEIDLDHGASSIMTLQISNQQGVPLQYQLQLEELDRGHASGTYYNLDADCKGMTWLNGKLYYVTYQTNQLKRYNPDTQSVEESWSIHSAPYGITTDGSILYIASANGRIYRYSPTGIAMGSFQNPLVSFTPALCFKDNALYVTSASNSNSTIYKLSTTGAILSQYTSNLSRCTQIIWVPDHQMFYGLQPALQQLQRFILIDTGVDKIDVVNLPMGQAYALAHNGKDIYLLENAKNYMTRHDDGMDEFNWIRLSGISGSVPAGDMHSVNLYFSAINSFAGNYQANLAISSNDPTQPIVSIPLQMIVTGQPELVWPQTELDLGVTYLGYPTTLPLRLENNGSSDLVLDNLMAISPFHVNPGPLTIPAWQYYDLTVEFAPLSLGVYNGTLSFTTNDANASQLQISLTGECLEAPGILVDPLTLSYSLLNDEAQQAYLSITNNGITPLNYQIALEQGLSPTPRSDSRGSGETVTRSASQARTEVERETQNHESSRNGGDLLNEYPLFPQNAGALALNGFLWVINTGTDELVKCSLSSATVINAYPIHDQPYGISWDGSHFLIGNQGGIIYRYDPASLQTTTLNQPISFMPTNLGGFPAFCHDGDHLIVASAFNSSQPATFRRYNDQGLLLNEYYSQIFNLAQLCLIPQYDEDYLWAYQNVISNQTPVGGRLLKLSLSGNQVLLVGSIDCWDDAYAYTVAHDGSDFLISDIDGPLQRYDDGHWLGTTSLRGQLSGNSNASLPIDLQPAGCNGGSYSGAIRITSNDPARPSLSIPVSLQVQGYPAIAVNPFTAVYDSTLIGNQSQKLFNIHNPGTDLLIVSAISSTNPAFIPQNTQFSIPAGSSLPLGIEFTPGVAGWQEGVITLVCNATGQPEAQIQVSGYAIAPTPEIMITPNPFGYPDTYTNATTNHNFILKNTGTAALVVTGFTSSTGMFAVNRSFPFSLLPDASLIIPVVFNPAQAIQYQDELLIDSNIPGPDYILDLSGTGLTPLPNIAVSPLQLSFGNMVAGVSKSLNLQLTNTGQLPLIIDQISSPYPHISFSATEANLLSGEHVTIHATLTAPSAEQVNSSVSISSSDPDTPLLSVPLTANVANGLASLAVSPSPLVFGLAEIGSSISRTIRVVNTGNIPLQISSIQTSTPVFTPPAVPPVIAPGTYSDLSVSFSPQNPGLVNGMLIILSNSATQPNFQVPLTGQGKHPIQYSITPSIIDAYTNQPGIVQQTMTITNTGLSSVEFEFLFPNPPEWLNVTPENGMITPGNDIGITFTMDTGLLNFDLYETILFLHTSSLQQPYLQIPVYLNYSNFNITTHDNEDNLGSGLPDNDLDVLLSSSNAIAPVEFNIFTDALTLQSAQLKISSQGVVNGEISKVYINNQYLGNLAAAPYQVQDSYFNLNPAWLQLGPTVKNTVRISLDETNIDPAGTMVMLGKLDYNQHYINAGILEMTATPQTITEQSLITIEQHLQTNLNTQTLRIESRLKNAAGVMMLNMSTRVITLQAYQPGVTSASWNLNGLLPSGNYYVDVKVYDAVSNQLQDTGRLDLVIGENRPFIAVDPPTLNFGQIYQNFGTTEALRISNLGAMPLEISNLLFSNLQFTASENTLSIPPGGSYDLQITAILNQLDDVNGQLTISSNDPVIPILNVSLLASGIAAPLIESSTAQVISQMQQYDNLQQIIQISNAGGSILQISSVEIEGVGWISAQIAETTLQPDQSTQLTITFSSYGLPFGLYWATLKITSTDPGTPILSIPIEVDVTVISVVADFSASILTGLSPLSVDFFSQSFTTDGSSVIGWEWDFEDDGIADSQLENPSHVYYHPGTYNVRLRVITDGAGTHSLLRANFIYVSNNPPVVASPIPDILLNEDTPLSGYDISPYFTDPDGDPLSFSVAENPFLTFSLNSSLLNIIPAPDYFGSELITISAHDPNGASVSQTAWIHVVAVNDPPVFVEQLPPFFNYLRWTQLEVDVSQYFSDPDSDPTLVTVSVTGNVNTIVTIDQHLLTFEAVGDWFGVETIQITVDDNIRRTTSTSSVELRVLESMIVDFSASPTDVLAGLPVQFTSNILGNPNRYEWDFENDGVIDSDLPNPSFVYNIGGLKSVRLHVMYVSDLGVVLHEGTLVRPDYIQVRGTMVPGGEALGSWVLDGSPYNILGSILIPQQTSLVISPDVEVNVIHSDISIQVEGALTIDSADIRSLDPEGWIGIEIGLSSTNSAIVATTISDARQPLTIKAGALIQNCVIEKDPSLNFPDEWAVEIEGPISPVLNGLEIADYYNGINIDCEQGAAQPVVSNIRVRNTSNSLRDPSLGIKLRGAIAPQFQNIQIEDFDIGLIYEGNNQPMANQPVISNIRVRNTSNSLRTMSTGLWIRNLRRVSVSQDSLINCFTGLRIDNDQPGLANQPTVSNIRIRNTSNSLRNESTGIRIDGNVHPRIFDVDIDEYVNGISMIGVNAALGSGQPVISNVRVRNTANSLRPLGCGLYIQDFRRISVSNDSLFGYPEAVKFVNTQPNLSNQPTVSNIRVRNSTNSLRNTGTAIYSGPGVDMSLTDSRVVGYGVGVHTLDNASQIRRNLFIDNDNAVLIQNALPVFNFSYNDMVLTPQYIIDTGAAIKTDNVSGLNIHNNTVLNYPGLLWARNSNLSFQQNIGWADQAILEPFQSSASQIDVVYNDIRTLAGNYPGIGNINSDPLFIDPAAIDLNLHYNSPCIDTGNPAMPLDPDQSIADMGAHIYLHSAAINSDKRFVTPDANIQFTNTSQGHPSSESQFYWDFNNDGIVDSNLENPNWSYSQLGRYDVQLRVTTGNLADTLLLYNYILVQSSILPPPQNLSLTVLESRDVQLNWDPVTHDINGNLITPPFYIVYYSPTPQGQFLFTGLTEGLAQYKHFNAAEKGQMFYIVIGFVGTRAELNDFLRSKPYIEIGTPESLHNDGFNPKNQSTGPIVTKP